MKLLKSFLSIIFVLTFCLISVSDCSNPNDYTSQIQQENTEAMLNYSTKDEYKNHGYFELNCPSSLSYKIAKTNFAQFADCVLVKSSSEITFDLNNSNCVSNTNNSIFYNFKNAQAISGYSVNGNFYNFNQLIQTKLIANQDLIITENYENFDVVGTFVYCKTNETSNFDISNMITTNSNELTSNNNALLFSYFSTEDLKSCNANNLKANCNSTCSLTSYKNIFRANFNIEVPNDINSFTAGIIIETESNNFDFLILEEVSNPTQNITFSTLLQKEYSINKITINLTKSFYDGTYKAK